MPKTGPEHYLTAQAIIQEVDNMLDGLNIDANTVIPDAIKVALKEAQVHALLATAAATAANVEYQYDALTGECVGSTCPDWLQAINPPADNNTDTQEMEAVPTDQQLHPGFRRLS